MPVRFPAKLVPGDLIAITAPSSGVPAHLHPRLDLAIANLKARGYRVYEGRCLREQYKNQSASPLLRAEELTFCLTEPEIKAVMPPWGGDLAIELLELLDFQMFAQAAPKWFTGFSDLSTLHFPLTTLSGWATVHGPNLMDLAARAPDATTQAIWRVLEGERGERLQQQSSAAFQPGENQWGPASDAAFNLTEKTRWKHLDGVTASACFQGRLIGGCLDIIARLAGTPFGHLPHFAQRNNEEGIILYFENVEMGPCELTRALFSLRLQGWFTHLNGILIGRSAGPNNDDASQHQYIDALRAALGDLTIPVIYDVDIGHIPPQMTLVNGASAAVTFTAEGGCLTQQL